MTEQKQNINFKIKYDESTDQIAVSITLPEGLREILKSCAVMNRTAPFTDGDREQTRYLVKNPITQGLYDGWQILFIKTLIDDGEITVYRNSVNDTNYIINGVKNQLQRIIQNYYAIMDREVILSVNIIEG